MKSNSNQTFYYLFALLLIMGLAGLINTNQKNNNLKIENQNNIKKINNQIISDKSRRVMQDNNIETNTLFREPKALDNISSEITNYIANQTDAGSLISVRLFENNNDTETERLDTGILAQTIPPGYDPFETEQMVNDYSGPEVLGEQCGNMELIQSGEIWDSQCPPGMVGGYTTPCGGEQENCLAGTCMGSCGTNAPCYSSGYCFEVYGECVVESCYGHCNADSGIAYLWDSITQICCCGI